MGITFGDNAEVSVGRDMVGEQTIQVYADAAAQIRELDLPLPYKGEAISALQRIKLEMEKEKPSENIIQMAAGSLARSAPDILKSLIAAIPAILQVAPAIQRFL